MAVVRLKPAAESVVERSTANSLAMLLEGLQDKNIVDTPLDISAVAEYLGIEVSYEIMDDDISGYLEYLDNVWVAGINALHHPNRQRFTLAHEIAHFILHRDQKNQFSDMTFARRTGDGSQMEKEADQFAANLLMPEDKVRAEISAGKRDLSTLSDTFKVSVLAMRYRVESLGFKVK